jgi:hypothetical protein
MTSIGVRWNRTEVSHVRRTRPSRGDRPGNPLLQPSLGCPVRLSAPLGVGDKIHIRGHTMDLVQNVASMEVEHAKVDRAGPGDDVALEVDDHVRDRDLIFHEA